MHIYLRFNHSRSDLHGYKAQRKELNHWTPKHGMSLTKATWSITSSGAHVLEEHTHNGLSTAILILPLSQIKSSVWLSNFFRITLLSPYSRMDFQSTKDGGMLQGVLWQPLH